MARIDKSFIPSPSTITCVLEINGTNYKKKKHFVYYESEGQKDSVIRVDAASNGDSGECKTSIETLFCRLILVNVIGFRRISSGRCGHLAVDEFVSNLLNCERG
jgi:hypothetical protein